jgi:methylated-DNA-[protein]-cysteine S-methyltransferase
MTRNYRECSSPLGQLTLVCNAKGLTAVCWPRPPGSVALTTDPARTGDADHPLLLAAERQLGEYFRGVRRVFDVPLEATGTDFQMKVWAALRTIPYGETRSYGWVAQQIGMPSAVRAVGGANNSNPIPILIPCHRVIGSSGDLTGFGGGLRVKAALLSLESPQASLQLDTAQALPCCAGESAP